MDSVANVSGTRGADVLDAVEAFLARFVAYPSEAARVAHTLWIAHAHALERWDSTPRISFLSAEPGSGKTRALEVTELLVPRPVESINTSPAYLFRKISDPQGPPTILYDEVDTVFGPRAKKDNEEIRAVINAGHRRGATAGRCVVRGREIFTEELPAFCPIALAGIGSLPDTILSRSIVVQMRRRAASESVQPFRRRLEVDAGNSIRDRLAQWAQDVLIEDRSFPEMPDDIADRAADVWEPLLAVADAAGGHWPARARVAAVALVAGSLAKSPSLGVRLLRDLQTVFDGRDSLSTEDILAALISLKEGPWGDLNGKAINERGLANLLDKYEVKSKTIRVGARTPRGYTRDSLSDAWSRYLSVPVAESATSATSATTAPSASIIALTRSATSATSETMTVSAATALNECQKCGGKGCDWCEL